MRKINVKLGGREVYVNPTTGKVKVGSKGKALPVGEMYDMLNKSGVGGRQLRKALRRAGFSGLAGVPTVVSME